MARASWSGYLSFGLVSVPVSLYSATSDQTIHFNQLHKGTSNRVRYQKVDEATGEELSAEDIVSGYPVGDGEYVVVTREEMKEAAPGKSELIAIQDFVDLDEIDPMYFRQTYYLGPKGKGADRAYTLLREAMRASNKVGIATVVLRDKEHLVAIRPDDDVLMLETMFFADEIRDPHEEVANLPKAVEPDPRELKVARQLIDALSAPWDATRYTNAYRSRVEELVERKRAGNAVVFGDDTERPTSNVIDLMSALRASIEKSGRKSGRPRATSASDEELNAMTKAELLDEARRLGVDVSARMNKAEVMTAIHDAAKPRRRGGRRAS